MEYRRRFHQLLSGFFNERSLVFIALFVFFGIYGYIIFSPQKGLVFQSWGVFHYYMNAKYFKELGYTNLYKCTAKALQENTEFIQANRKVRDLESYHLVDPNFSASECDISIFSQKRWEEFSRDVEYILNTQPSSYWLGVLKDKGFNASPAWLLFGVPLANLIPILSDGATILIQLDWILVGCSVIAIGIAFSWPTAAALALGITLFPGTFARLVGNYFQFVWLTSVLISLAFWVKKKFSASGAFFAIAVVLRLFPLLFLAGFLILYIKGLFERKNTEEFVAQKRFLVSFAGSLVIIVGLSSVLIGSWSEFIVKIITHAQFIIQEPFHIGFASFAGSFLRSGQGEWVYGILLVSALLLFIVAIGKATVIESFGISATLMYFLLTSSPYYSIAAVLLLVCCGFSNTRTKQSVYGTYFFWVTGIFFTTPQAFGNLHALARFIPEVLTLLYFLILLMWFGMRRKSLARKN